jgi:ABC-type nitrate/sulfonate/bicarbonate transport system substrate-binding protein
VEPAEVVTDAAVSVKRAILKAAVLLSSLAMLSCGEPQSLKVIVGLPALSVSKMPFVLAMDQGLYEKHGLTVEMWMPPPGSDSVRVYADPLTRLWRATGINTPQAPDIYVDGATPMMVKLTQIAGETRRIAVGATDCVVRAHIIGRKGMASLESLKGKRIGVSASYSTAGFKALLFAKRMGWDPVRDISIMSGVSDIDDLLNGSVDAIIGYEEAYAKAKRAGLPILADTSEWGAFVAGNSINVEPAWLEDPTHREAVRRFLKATAEATALYHQRPELAVQVIENWYGIDDEDLAKTIYTRGAWLPRKPYPCYEGYKKVMELYDSNEMRRYKPTDFYDDSLMREIDESGFLDGLAAVSS